MVRAGPPCEKPRSGISPLNAALTVEEVRDRLDALEASAAHAECPTCECYQGYLAQLVIDASAAAAGEATKGRLSPQEMHGCLGCDPCPPGDAFTGYLLERQGQLPETGGSCGCTSGCG